ncbi:MAG: hypothetical protein HFH36_03210 [Lachnospiraceae bacterium]|nr:hypothetical protein [Lachnospiraceae bacterium]
MRRTQKEILESYEKYYEIHGEEHEKAWLIRTAINYCRDVMKSSARKKQACLEERKLFAGEVVPEEYAEVYGTMLELPEKYRVLLYLYYYEGYTLKEIAGMLKANASTLRPRFAKASQFPCQRRLRQNAGFRQRGILYRRTGRRRRVSDWHTLQRFHAGCGGTGAGIGDVLRECRSYQ